MDNKCSKCGGELITGRLMTGTHFVGFTPLADEKKFKPRYVGLICDTCVQCGSVENIRVEKVDKLKSIPI
ncbi:MAG: hypothetical protein IJN11_01580 [Oscillospiraceae bacterium]|nr:hypothetical protein [Oscillospiraceae bacterium]